MYPLHARSLVMEFQEDQCEIVASTHALLKFTHALRKFQMLYNIEQYGFNSQVMAYK